MSDFDRNVAARGFGATGTAAAIDVGSVFSGKSGANGIHATE